MKILLDYDENTGILTDSNGMTYTYMGIKGFDYSDDKSKISLELIKQGISVDEIIKLKNQDLL